MDIVLDSQRTAGDGVYSDQTYTPSGTAPGATLTGTSSFIGGTATGGNGTATAPGAVLTGTSAFIGGTATGGQQGTAPGALLTGTSSITGGAATGGASGPQIEVVLSTILSARQTIIQSRITTSDTIVTESM